MSVRSNENRLGVGPGLLEEKVNEATTAIPDASSLKFVTPTEFVELPSRGRFYSEDHPLYGQNVVEMKHMTAREEDILTSVALLKKGLALDRLLESLLVDKRIKVDNLLLGDKNAMIVSARACGYGTEYETAINCPSCSETQKYSFNLDSLKINFPTDAEVAEHNVKNTAEGTFLIALPKTEYVVEVQLLLARDEKKIAAARDYKKKKNFPETTITDFLRLIIVSVNGVTDMTSLSDFVTTLPAIHARYLRRVYDKLVPALDMHHPFVCANCDHEGTMEVPLGPDFFWPNT